MAFQWNTEKLEEAAQAQDSFAALPVGEYRAMISSVTDKENKNGTGNYLLFYFEIIEGQYENRKISEYVNYKNTNPAAEQIAWKTLLAITNACFREAAKQPSIDDFEGKTLRIKVKQEQYNGQTQNKVAGYLPDSIGALIKAKAKPSVEDDKEIPF
jgi:hypothetical protein